jgi:hypothetical protein
MVERRKTPERKKVKGIFDFKFENLLDGEVWNGGETACPSSHLKFIIVEFLVSDFNYYNPSSNLFVKMLRSTV